MEGISSQPLCLGTQDHDLTKIWAKHNCYYCFILSIIKRQRFTQPNQLARLLSRRLLELSNKWCESLMQAHVAATQVTIQETTALILVGLEANPVPT